MTTHSLILSRSFPEHDISTNVLDFEYAVYALGSHLPIPIDLWGNGLLPGAATGYQGTKKEGIEWLKQHQKRIEASSNVLIVGGGALGVQYATDIAAIYPNKRVTLLHSRHQLLPKFDEGMHIAILEALEALNVEVIFGERLDLQANGEHNLLGQNIVRTMSGREITADLLLLCTGQTPNIALLKQMDPTVIDPENGMAHVLRTMQLGVVHKNALPTPPDLYPRVTDQSVDAGELGAILERLALETGLRDVSAPSNSDGAPECRTPVSLVSSDLTLAGCSPASEATLLDDAEDSVKDIGDEEEESPYPHIFVVGDAADAFGAIKAGHSAYHQVRPYFSLLPLFASSVISNDISYTPAEVAANNILRLIHRDGRLPSLLTTEKDEQLEQYMPGPPAIKLSLGLIQSVYQTDGVVGIKNDGVDDLNAASMWLFWDEGREGRGYVCLGVIPFTN